MLLAIDRELAGEDIGARLLARVRDRSDKRNQVRSQLRKNARHLRCGRARFVFIEQSVVGGFLVANGLRFLALRVTILSSQGANVGKSFFLRASAHTFCACDTVLAISSTSLPGTLTARSYVRRISRTLTALGVIGRRGGFALGQQFAETRRREHAVTELREKAHLLSAMVATLGRHIGVLVPVGDSADRFQ